MNRRWRFCVSVALLSVFVSFPGCGGGTATTDANDDLTSTLLTLVSMEYGAYLADHNGTPPPTADAFRSFVAGRADALASYNVTSAEELLTSPRDGQPFVIVCGKKLSPPDSPSTPWAAFEKVGVGGKHMAVAHRGALVTLTDAELAQQIPFKP